MQKVGMQKVGVQGKKDYKRFYPNWLHNLLNGKKISLMLILFVFVLNSILLFIKGICRICIRLEILKQMESRDFY